MFRRSNVVGSNLGAYVCIAYALFATSFGLFQLADKARGAERPNIVLVLVDDLGWRDLGCYGSDYYQTPNIDSLAERGVLFTDGYAACNVCSPTRAAILTGKYPARLLLTQWLPSGRWSRTKNRMQEGRYISNLPLEEWTLAEHLRENGYRTAFLGKWHLGTETYYYPEHQGFEVNVAGRDYGAPGSYFYPFEGTWRIPTTNLLLQKQSPLSGKPGDYLPDRLAEEACRIIAEDSERPLFLMLSHYAVHAPLQAKESMIGKYAAVPAPQQQGKPAYAAMVESVDQSVGRVVEALRTKGVLDETIIVFTSDNGGFAKATNNSPLRANKGSNYEGGIRVPFIVSCPAQVPAGKRSSEPVISMDIYPTLLSAAGVQHAEFQHVDGADLWGHLVRSETLQRDSLFWHYPHYNQHPASFPSGVIRAGRWKLIEDYESGERMLYDLQQDLSETKNLAAQQPELAHKLATQLEQWRVDVGADPMRDNPFFGRD